MTYAADISTLRAPLVDNWDFSQTPVVWESEGDAPKRFLSGDRSAPGEFILWRHEFAPGEYLASGGGNEVWKHADVDCQIRVEGIAGARATAIIAARADSLVSYYVAASAAGVVFRTPEAYLTNEYEVGAWIARDWVCPVWIFASN